MLILLPPSEGKTRPPHGAPLDLESLSFPTLTPVRAQLLRMLIKMCSGNPKNAMEALGLGPTQAEAIEINAGLDEEPTARADEIYTGVLFSISTCRPSIPHRAHAPTSHWRSRAPCSASYGPSDHIPAYRLSGDGSLPRLGTVASRWRTPLPRVLRDAAGDGLMIDLRSGMYAALGKPPADLADRTVTMRVLHEHQGVRKVVSHFNKATKGRIVRALLESGADPASVDELQDLLGELGWTVERQGQRLDVVVAEI